MQRDKETILEHHREKSVDNRKTNRILNREAPINTRPKSADRVFFTLEMLLAATG